ncbi:MAG TPA: sugar transferase [Candidatus Acidoferrum sp.]|jgi:lipopolysaccharide/colanic/teichoic acid biosynthesis glycosyltransferase|nr:sugar transferase [Candidatus Acidoferrum sp.]
MGNSYSRIPALWEQGLLRLTTRKAGAAASSLPASRDHILLEESFHSMLTLERRRAERSRKPFVLMLLDASAYAEEKSADRFLSRITSVLLKSTRETDLVGWYENGAILGVIFTEVSLECESPITQILHSKIVKSLQSEFSHEVASSLVITLHLFPESSGRDEGEPVADTRFYPDLSNGRSRQRLPLGVKRVIDILGSAFLLLLLSPLLAIIAIAIKLTSKGPVIFRQERLGQFGSRFKCLKFRTMYANNDPKVHQEFVQQFIAGQSNGENADPERPVVYKITNDARITPFGKFLRKTSLDEFPQFWNVFRGDMSLVGPRPSLPYEFEVYDIWHRRRVLEVKPGVTGLWQVSGRSRTCFDDMVRLDLRYTKSWSIWLDLKILLATPRAVFKGDGAY